MQEKGFLLKNKTMALYHESGEENTEGHVYHFLHAEGSSRTLTTTVLVTHPDCSGKKGFL